LWGACSLAVAGPFTITAGNGNITNGAFNFGAPLAAGAPTFDANHHIVSVGNGLGTVGAGIGAQLVTANGFPGAISQCVNLGGACGVLAAPFGTSATTEFSGPSYIGFYFALSDPGPNGQASVTYSEANGVVFTNTSGFGVTGYVGAVLAIQGTFGGQAGAVAGAAIDGAISWNGGVAQEATVSLFGSSVGANTSSLFTSGVGFQNITYSNCGFAFGCNNFVAWGVSLLNNGNQITIPNGQTLALTGALSVVVDPPIFSDVFSLDPTTVVPNTINLPTLGAQSSVPEPGTLGLIGVALAGFGFIRRVRSRT
jgi:hypothetical protein